MKYFIINFSKSKPNTTYFNFFFLVSPCVHPNVFDTVCSSLLLFIPQPVYPLDWLFVFWLSLYPCVCLVFDFLVFPQTVCFVYNCLFFPFDCLFIPQTVCFVFDCLFITKTVCFAFNCSSIFWWSVYPSDCQFILWQSVYPSHYVYSLMVCLSLRLSVYFFIVTVYPSSFKIFPLTVC